MNTNVDRISSGVAVVSLDGELDASNFRDVIATGRDLYAEGARLLVLDLSGLEYMASSGIVALHSLALIFRGIEPPDPEAGWSAFHAVSADAEEGPAEEQVRLAGPNASIDRILDRTGLKRILPVFADRDAALAG